MISIETLKWLCMPMLLVLFGTFVLAVHDPLDQHHHTHIRKRYTHLTHFTYTNLSKILPNPDSDERLTFLTLVYAYWSSDIFF